jgi:hypothetical protein
LADGEKSNHRELICGQEQARQSGRGGGGEGGILLGRN